MRAGSLVLRRVSQQICRNSFLTLTGAKGSMTAIASDGQDCPLQWYLTEENEQVREYLVKGSNLGQFVPQRRCG